MSFKNLWLVAVNLVLGLAGSASLWFGISALRDREETSLATIGLGGGLLLLLAASIERFEVLKGLGIEARMKKELDEKISEATAKLAQLRELAELSCDFVVSLMARAGRWDTAPSTEEAYEIIMRVRRHLESLNSSEEIIRKTIMPWAQSLIIDLMQELTSEIHKKVALGREHYELQLRNFPPERGYASPDYQKILDNRNRFTDFLSNSLSGWHNLPIETVAARLLDVVERAPLIQEEHRKELLTTISPWLPRINYLGTYLDLKDKEMWFEILKDDDVSLVGSPVR